MDTEKLSKQYMKEYDQLILDFKTEQIDDLLHELNESVAASDPNKTNEIYSKLMDWNMRVANLDGVRDSLNGQFSYLHLPSPSLYSIVLDTEEKVWRYNTETH